jgi:CP family cyanate transporter-like MFS transporter
MLSVLFLGTFLAGAAIAVANVLLPGLVKRDFPRNIALMTGVYTMALCGGATIAAALTVPLEQMFDGWRPALAAWALPAVVVLAVWLPQALAAPHEGRNGARRIGGLMRDPLAWQVTLLMGLQSALAYIVFGWLAPMLRERGLDGVTAGLVLSVSILFQMIGCLVSPAFATRGRDQRLTLMVLIAMTAIGFVGCYGLPLGTVWIWSILLGIGQGGMLAVALTVIILRAPDAYVAAQLSGMAQGFGYTIAATGPLLAGLLRDWTGGYGAPTVLFLGFIAASALSGMGAGRNRLVGFRRDNA